MTNEQVPLLEQRQGSRNRLERFLNDPTSSSAAMVFFSFICLVIVISSLLMVFETLPEYYGSRRTHWFWLETSIVVILSIEFILRLIANFQSIRTLLRWVVSWSFFTESLSVLPFWIDIVMGGKAYAEVQRLTVLRLFRLLRLVHLMSGSGHLQRTLDALYTAVGQCADVLAALFLLQFLAATVFATLLYFAERGIWDGREWIINDKRSKFDSIPACYWYVYTVLSTVGLGDMAPQTTFGRLLTWPLMMLTILLLTFPSVIIANHFTSVWSAR